MIENQISEPNTKEVYRKEVNAIGKKEFTFQKMQEFGFWPKNLPTPYERQLNETPADYAHRKELIKSLELISGQIADAYQEKDKILKKLRELKKEYSNTWDYDKIRADVAKQILQESLERRARRKEERALEKQRRQEAWLKTKAENIVFIGTNYSSLLSDKVCDKEKLLQQQLPILEDDKDLAKLLELEYKQLRFLTYHRDVVSADHYHHYTIPKKKGGLRSIAAPKSLMKKAQRKILEEILEKIPASGNAHGFLKGKSVISGAKIHTCEPDLLLNIDLENFFPTITFERVRGLFHSFGYSNYIASLCAMLCTYCERVPIEIKGEIKYVKSSERILPQGSPASPMITNLICRRMDQRLDGFSKIAGFTYTRYADDMSFSFQESFEKVPISKILNFISKIVSEEGFSINKNKTRFLKKHNCQSITGVVINHEEIGVKKDWVKKLRAAIHQANKQIELGSVSDQLLNQISGMACWLKSVNKERYEKILTLAEAVTKGEKR